MSFFGIRSGKEKVSQPANYIGEIFNTEDVGLDFLDLTLARFEHFDESNLVEGDKKFSDDISHILQCAMDSLTPKTSDKFEYRTDSYFYIYRRLEEYFTMKKKSAWGGGSSTSNLEIFRRRFYDMLINTFVSSKGTKPNLCSNDEDLWKRMNISQHLSSIKTIDTQTLNSFFVLCKLSMQSSSAHNRPKWVDILSRTESIKLTLHYFINQYAAYINAFTQFPLDTPAYIYLIQKMHPIKQNSVSPFDIFISEIKVLKLKPEEFFDLFQPVFIKGVKDKRYELEHISKLFKMLSINEHLFYKYVLIYSSSVNLDDLWNMFLHLCTISNINDVIKTHLTAILIKRISTVSVETFNRYTQSARESLTEIKSEFRPCFIEIFEKIYDSFIITQIEDPQYSYRLTQTDYKELLKIGLLLTSTHSIKRPSCSLLIRELLFKIDNRVKNTAEKLKYLFQNINSFDENLYKNYDPTEILKDEWLKDFLITNSQIWFKLDQETYKYLCNHHQNNHWIIYIWTRIIHLSLLKLTNENPNDTLLKLNEWMKTIKHNIYDPTDILTIIFVIEVFELIIIKHTKSIMSLPNIEIIMNFIFSIKQNQSYKIDTAQVDMLIRNSKEIVQEILQLKSTCSIYRDLLHGSILYSILPFIDIKQILSSINSQYFKFPGTTPNIDVCVSLQKPKDIDIKNFQSNEEFFSQFIEQINQWFQWFDRFIDIFQPIIEWLKTSNVIRANQCFNDLYIIRNDSKISFIHMKTIIENVSKLLQPISDLRRLCHLFNCLTSFQIIDSGTLNTQDNTVKYITELKRSQPNNTFTIERRNTFEHIIPITDHQQVQWSLANENQPCDIDVSYQINDHKEELFKTENIAIHKHVLYGQFESQQAGQLILIINNKQNNSCRVWYRIRSTGLSTCHLFHGIFNIFYERYYKDKFVNIRENELSQLLDEVFLFIDKLLNGSLSLRDMKDLQNIFCDKNIHIKEEVKKLYTNRTTKHRLELNQPNENEIEQVCEWLQIYQYYSHINIIIECIEKFDILPHDNNDEIIGDLRRLGGNENCSLREITQAYKILQQRFQKLTHQHLQLIKTVVECSNVIHMMKQSDLYSNHGRRRFLELRDNLTTQFQLQERNNIILNAWIITYTLIEPFISKAKNFDDFVSRLVQSPNLEESSLNHIKIVNDNMQIVNMWLSAGETTGLDNALITMEHLYKTGTVHIHLRYLMNEQSYFKIKYSIDRIQGQTLNEEIHREEEKLKFKLSMSDIDDHKRQLTFCNVDVQQNLVYKKVLINGQLKLLETVENIYSILIKLELAGHPDYQLRDEQYQINLQHNQNISILSELRNHQNIQLVNSIEGRTNNLQQMCKTFQTAYDIWIQNLFKHRHECSLLKLFSNRQIMFLIILLRTSSTPDSIRNRFLKKLFSFKDLNNQNDEEQKLTIQCLIHYLRSLRIHQCDLSHNNILNLYTTHQIHSDSNVDLCLKKLSEFLKDLFHNVQELFEENQNENNNQQYLVRLDPISQTDEKITFEHDFDMNTCCILLNIFNNRLPSSYQILWCSNITNEDIQLFFSRIRTFCYLTFVIMDIDKMHHRFRENLLNEQDLLAREKVHGTVYYFSRELTTSRKGLREFPIPSMYRNPKQTYTQLMTLFQKQQVILPQIQIVYGTAGIGKTHRINARYKDQIISCFSINDKLNLSLLISSFLLFDSNIVNDSPTIYFNISIHAPFETLNRTLFSLFICGSLNDSHSGLTFSLPITKPWKFVIEIPYSDITHLSIKENFDQILPLLSIISSSSLEEVTSENYQLSIGEEEELVARFLNAFENRTIDRLSTELRNGACEEVKFDPLTNPDESRKYIYDCINKYAPELPRNKIYELSFTKFLYRRARFFVGHFFRYNQTIKQLGSIAMRQMIEEAKALSQINFENNNYPRVYLVYDPDFSLHLLHTDWNHVSNEIKSLFDNHDPVNSIEYKHKDYFAECLAWLINISYETFLKVMNETKFILTENFAYKLFHVHERKLTKLALIIEGDTGVGKTFLLKFYSLLLNSKNTKNRNENNIIPKFTEHSSLFLLGIITGTVENQPNLLNTFLLQIKPKILGLENNDEDDENINQNLPAVLPVVIQQEAALTDAELLKEIKLSLQNSKYNKKILYHIWKSILTASGENAMNTTPTLIEASHNYVSTDLTNYPLIEGSGKLKELLQKIDSPTADMSIEIFKEYLFYSQIKPLFYRLLLHPGITEEQLVEFMSPISQLARELPNIEIVVFFDEVNTSSCLGLFKEMFMDGTIHGTNIPKNIFFTAAINPLIKTEDNKRVHRSDFLVHELPQALKHLKVSYGSLESKTLADYIVRKINMFQLHSSDNGGKSMPLDRYFQDTLADSILKAQEFCEEHLGRNSVSQREIQRCFNLIEFFWNMRYDDEIENGRQASDPNPVRCIALSIALIYYFRLPTTEDNSQREDNETPSREQLANILSQTIPDFEQVIQNELVRFVNTENFVIPQGVAINQAVREHIFSIVVSIVTRTPLCIIGVPGQSKTLSFQIVLQNLQGSQLSSKKFCKRLPAIDPFFCLGSKYSRSEDIAYIFDRAIKREQQYEQNRMNTRCVVFLDEASLPDEKKMVLKVLHPYLDECKVAFVAVANKSFDAANANRMICIYRSLPSEDDQKILAYGCLGLQTEQGQKAIDNRLQMIISGLCQGYRRILQSPEIPEIFHDRDFIYMLRELRFELANINENQETSIGEITPRSLFRALEDNFHGIHRDEFEKLIDIFFTAVNEKCPNFRLSSSEKTQIQRNIPTILRESMKLDSVRRRLYGRYKLIIDESEDESAIRLLSQTGILDPDPNRTTVFRMPDFPDDIDNELRNVEILSTIKLCMETGKTILMVNTGRIHGALYDVFNQNFSIMATDDTRKIFSKVAIGPKTIDVIVHEDFQCIVHVKRSEFKDIPPPFLSRFQKYSLSVIDFYSIHLKELPANEQFLLENVKEKALSFIQHFGEQYFYGLNDSTLYSCLLSLIKRDENGQYFLSNIHRNYSQLTIQSKSFIEQNPADIQQCILFSIMSILLQLVSPESIIYKLPAFEEKIGIALRNNYFYQQEHFNIENFLQRFISTPSIEVDNNDLFTAENDLEQKLKDISIKRKVMVFTRTSSFVVGLNKESKKDLFKNNNKDDEYMNTSEKIDVLNLVVIENSVELQKQFQDYEQDRNKKVLIIIIDTRISQQCLHIPFVRQLIDKTDKSCNLPNEIPQKFFLILVHSSGQEFNSKSCFSSIFLHDWDYHYLDTCTPGSAFHLQKILQIFTSSFGKQENITEKQSLDNMLCDFNILFEDCLRDFCSRIKISAHKLPKQMFKSECAYEFYQPQTSTNRRVQCLQELLQQSTQLQKRIVTNYHENVSKNKESLQKNCHSIYEISKDILCGKHSTSLVDSLQSEIRISFTNFVSNFFKFIVNDYGLETLSKLTTTRTPYEPLLNLIDYSAFATNYNEQTTSIIQSNLSLRINYFFIPQTPLYSLFHERIKSLADEIKSTLVQKENHDTDDLRLDYYAEPPTTTFNNYFDDYETVDNISEQFRKALIKSLMNDKILTKIMSQAILESYTNDSIQRLCTTIETNFNNNLHQCEKTIEFISNWLLHLDENEKELFHLSSNKSIWLLAHVYTSIEYEQNDIFSLYSACRIIECLDQNTSFYIDLINNDQITRSKIRENLFRLMFDHLWKKLRYLCSTQNPKKNIEQWIHSYTFISKYFPSENVLQRQQLVQVKGQIEFMNLSYLIFLNEKTPEPEKLVFKLLEDTSLIREDNLNSPTSICLQFLPIIIKTIHQYYENNSTLLIDIQQWIISTLKTSNQSCRQEIIYLFQFLNQSTCQLSLPMKQFLFDQLANIYLEFIKQNQIGINKHILEFWDRISLLPIIIECLSDIDLQNYQIPYHPSVIKNDNQKQILIDLYFFYLQRFVNDEMIKCDLINKILLSTLPQMTDRRLIPTAEIVFKQLKDYFLLQTTALLLCQQDLSNNHDQQRFDRMFATILTQYLTIDSQLIQLNKHLELFLSIIITKRSWTFLLNLFKSERFQRLNTQWSNNLLKLFEFKHNTQRNQSLQLCHQLQFTITTNTTLSNFPKLHQPYEELSKLMDQCIKITDLQLRWKSLSDWIQVKLTSLNSTEIKVMLLLNIYYNYYCNNQLTSLENLLTIIENTLQPLSEELRVFRVFLQPEQYMIGYPKENNNVDMNSVNNLFKLDCKDNDELNIRHSLVNLLAMILLSGKQNFLWTFTFEPLKLQNTLGFGSTRHEIIQAAGVHYDCGCLLTENGDLIQFPSGKGNGGALNVPAVYVAYFSTFGAFTWHLLLFDTSVQNLYGPILAKHAIDCTTVTGRIVGDSVRAKVCHFVRARLLATNHFLSIHTNEDDACILLNRSFEQMAGLTKQENLWIKSVYTKFEEKFQAEQEYQNQIFYPVYQQLAEYKKLMNSLYLQSQIQKNLQDYVLQMPILVQFKHFKTELCNPKTSQLSLNILRHILDSFDFLKITHFIYDLSQFYLLLHRTYAQLIKREEFAEVTLEELYQRGEEHLKNSNRLRDFNQNNKHLLIIENGIKAVNAYHKFADGLIRPGACDETQRFVTISIQTPIHYLVTSENHDEGDIIMRILSVLIDYHNSILDLMENEIEKNVENNGIGLLKNLINELTSKEVSILQIAQDNTGVITLNNNDCFWIEQLSRASLQNEEYFPQLQTQLNFNFLYVQSYIIRSYLLLCRINYRHISQKYQWSIPPKMNNLTTENNEDILNEYPDLHLEDEWNHLKEMNFDKLYNGYNLLRRIIDLLKTSNDDLPKENLYEYLQTMDDDQTEFLQQLEQYEIKNFPLFLIHYICQLYEQTINHYQHSFINISHLLRIPIETNLNEQLDQRLNTVFILFDDNQDKQKLQSNINRITEFLNELKDIENSLLHESSKSLKQTCQYFFDNSILELIPTDIKCQNYVPLGIKLIEIRSKLQEKTIHLEEKNTNLWNASFDIPLSQQQTMFGLMKNPNLIPDEPVTPPESPDPQLLRRQNVDEDLMDSLIQFIDPTDPDNTLTSNRLPPPPPRPPQPILFIDKIDCTSLFELNIKSIPSTSSDLFNKIPKQTETSITPTKMLRITLTHPNGTNEKYLCRIERIYEQLKKIFEEKKYHSDEFVIVDQNHLFVDYANTSTPYISPEYRIIEKTLLVLFVLEFENQQIEYLATRESQISSIINRFIIDQKLEFTSPDVYLAFFDELGKYIEEDSSINDVYRTNNSNITRIKVLQCKNNINKLCEVTLRLKEDEQEIRFFDPITNWKQIVLWLKTQNILTEIPVHSYHFWDREHRNILDKHQSISSTLGNSTSLTIDGINEDDVMEILLSHDKNEKNILILKSCPVYYLLHNPQYLQELNLKISPTDCILVLIDETDQQILTNDDIQQPIGSYSSDDNQIIHFQISILIQLIQFDNQQELQIPISNRNLTIKQFFELAKTNDIYQYLASIDTHMIFSDDDKLSNINQTKFYLVKEIETCLISIDQSNSILIETDEDITIYQRYIIYTTIANIYKQNKSFIQDYYLVYEKDFIPAENLSLTSFLSTTSPIRFTLIDRKFQANVTVINEEDGDNLVQLHCSPSISVGRVCHTACQLFHINKRFYRLILLDNTNVDDDYPLDELGESIDNIQFKLKSIADVKCQIIYENKTILIPANNETLASTILEEALEKLCIPNEDFHMYKLNIFDDPENPTQISLEYTIEEIRSEFPDYSIIPFQVQKN